MWAYTHLPHRRSWSAGEIATVAARMEAAIEHHAPGFGSSVLARLVTGPALFEAENRNLVAGSMGGGTSAMQQQLFLRPIPGLGRADTPIDGLFLASASAHPGGGVHGGPGANAARAALARSAPLTGRIYGGAVRMAHRHIYGGPVSRPGPDP